MPGPLAATPSSIVSAGPSALLLVVVLGIVLALLMRSLNKRVTRLPTEFPEPPPRRGRKATAAALLGQAQPASSSEPTSEPDVDTASMPVPAALPDTSSSGGDPQRLADQVPARSQPLAGTGAVGNAPNSSVDPVPQAAGDGAAADPSPAEPTPALPAPRSAAPSLPPTRPATTGTTDT